MANTQRSSLRFVLVSAAFMAVCMCIMAVIPSMQGWNVFLYLFLYFMTILFYTMVVHKKLEQIPLNMIFVFAILYRLVFIYAAPLLSDDVYRFIWEGHLMLRGINPYQYPVNSPMLDAYSISYRNLVNHNWLASPYLPVAQIGFALTSLVPINKILAFKIGAIILDLTSGWIIIKLLRQAGLQPQLVILYLWHPLVIVEFAQNGHFVEALMVLLTLAACMILLAERKEHNSKKVDFFSPLLLAGATLTKGLPGMLVFAFFQRWKWRELILYIFCLFFVCAGFVWGAGIGLSDPATGTGLFGALRVYLSQWNFNGGILHWIELSLVGYQQNDAIRAGTTIRLIFRGISFGLILGTAFFANLPAWYRAYGRSPQKGALSDLTFLQIAILPFGVYLLTSQTLYPWYLTLMLAFLPFFGGAGQDQPESKKLFTWAWLYLSISIFLTYLSFFKFPTMGEYILIQCIEYLPLYGILAWAGWSSRNSLKRYFQLK